MPIVQSICALSAMPLSNASHPVLRRSPRSSRTTEDWSAGFVSSIPIVFRLALRLFGNSLSVRMNIIPPTKVQARFTAERVARTRPKTYRAIVRLLAEPDAKIEHVAQRHRVSTHTVRAIRERESVAIAERKKQLVSILADVATLGSERMVATIGKASLRDAAIGTGIAVDKMLALTGQTQAVQIANILMPSEAERTERWAIDKRLDEIARRLADAQAPSGQADATSVAK